MEQMEADDELEQAEQQVQFWENEVRTEDGVTDGPSVRNTEWNLTTASESAGVTLPQQDVSPSSGDDVPDKVDGKADLTNLAQLVQAMTLAINTPKPELLSFSGDPADYSGFIHNFDVNIASKVSEDRVKLTYLIQFCRGKARESIENCVLMEEKAGYKLAKEILRDQFGQPHVITQSLINKVTDRQPIRPNDGAGLWELARQMRKCQVTLSQIGYSADMNSSDRLLKVQRLLPIHLQSEWAKRAQIMIQGNMEPNFSHLTDFIEQKAKIASNMFGQNIGTNIRADKTSHPSFKSKPAKVTTLATQGSNAVGETTNGRSRPQRGNYVPKCRCCSQSHTLKECREFQQRSYDDRLKFVRSNKLCDNCFRPGHMAKGCMLKSTCEVSSCTWRHHTLLHPPHRDDRGSKGEGANYPSSSSASGAGDKNQSHTTSKPESRQHGSVNATAASMNRVCLRVVPVRVQGKDKEFQTWALLDGGSDTSLCDRRLLDQLGLQGIERNITLATVNDEHSEKTGVEVSLTVKDLEGRQSVDLPKVWTVDKLPITDRSFPREEDVSKWPHLQGISFPMISERRVMLLIGGDTPEVFWVLEERRGKRKEPYAVRSLLGWTLLGPTATNEKQFSFNVNHVLLEDDLLLRTVEKFWETDFGGKMADGEVADSVEDKRARTIMTETVTKVDGHYQVGLPWRYQSRCLPDNRPLAESRLQSLKRRFQRDPSLYEKYKKTLDVYFMKGYAREISSSSPQGVRPETTTDEQLAKGVETAITGQTVWYLPHHPVLHPQKPGKLRVVYDCAAKYKGVSLNDQLLQGPDFANNLVGVLTRFREEPVALVADVEAMFHQVKVPDNDSDALRFLWWPNGDYSKEPTDHKMLVHLFGATSSPSCAGFCLRKTAEDNRENFDKETVTTVLENFYVDDCLVSTKTESEAIRLASQLIQLLAKGGFRLTKWVCNSRDVLVTIPAEERAPSVVKLDFDHLPVERTLGVRWDVEADKFGFEAAVKCKPATRRGILSTVSSLYDPLGFLAPFILPVKILLQDLCRQGRGWDEKVEECEMMRWKRWLDDLPRLTCVTIDRCLQPREFSDIVAFQLHHFSDASERGYAAVSYLRVVDVHGKIHCAFVMGKARLCPVKQVTIPRLELSAAVLAVRLNQLIQREIRLPIMETVYWTDSTSVLQYIQNESRRFHTFVANRVSRIQSGSDPSQWRYVDTASNPADDGSRGLTADAMIKNQRWLNGPDFLLKEVQHWPLPPVVIKGPYPDVLPDTLQSDPEVKKVVQSYSIVEKDCVQEFLSRYSSWSQMKRGVAWLLRYRDYLYARAKGRRDASEFCCRRLSLSELQRAEREVVKYTQRQSFRKEIAVLEAHADITTKKSKKGPNALHKLSPILVDGILRVGGRLENAPIQHDIKHPIILPSDHQVTRLLIEHHHLKVGHSGAGMTWTSLRERFWILKGGSTVRRVIGKCFRCKKRNAPLCQQLMGELPADRVTPEKPPFTYVGVDYFGPLYVKQGRSHVKRYGCVFTCLTMRAIHIEIAHSLDTDAFINALRRFISRRGTPEKIRSDNGTNFTGGERELRESIASLNEQKIGDYLHQRGIEWQFNPPTASHMGGVWERMIRSIRKILKNLLQEQVVCDEVLLTVMAEVEAILNARPLTQLSLDPRDDEPLTPNHLLLMRPSFNAPPGVFVKEDGYGRRRWRQAQFLADQFWRRWKREYLPLLQQRQKWTQPRRDLEVNDLVLVAADNEPRGQWPLGRVMQVYPDKEGRVRQVE
ncbi:uncharacterized protein LOC119733173 [Patiria miniata]|uniref:Integrase catalytic domain-containing protein n=1 Tax=Patiria miniata TaxID=46514 RepID=A0A914AH09_PATMI|nr:uncharacterized protein LOC119733173 [Patiria miniata]